MNAASRILLLTLVSTVTGWAVADLPKKAPIAKYTGLWTNSPFTSKPIVTPAGEPINVLSDYALVGVSPVGSGYRVTMMNRKKPEERVTVDSDNLKSEFKILEVTRKAGDPLATVVRMSSGSGASAITGSVGFDDKLLVLATPPPTKPPQKPMPGAMPVPTPGVTPATAASSLATRQARPRVVPPPSAPNPAGSSPGNGSSSHQRSSYSNSSRPIHRGGGR